eukprot:2512637-Heterocapsa_arctica.AAC.1
MGSKAERCQALGLRIENIKGDGNRIYTSLGKAIEMNGNQVRDIIVEKHNMHWCDIMEFDIDGEEYINFLGETDDRKQWGGARQVAISARTENVRVDIHSYGNVVQTYDYDNGDEQNKRNISVLWCNIQKWGAQPNHDDLLHPIYDKKTKEQNITDKYIDNFDAEMLKCNIEANQIST